MNISATNLSLSEKAKWVWAETLRIYLNSPEVRLASSLSSVEIFVSLYYGGVLRFNPSNPRDEGRDRCVISKGHGSICMYPILADLGYFDRVELKSICKAGSFLGGIPDPIIPGYETLNGSLGHGLGVGAGMALALNRKNSDRDVFVVTGDGELHEGSNWEAIMFAAQNRLENLHLIVDDNSVSMLGYTRDIIDMSALPTRLSAFGWDVQEVDGHDADALTNSLLRQKSCRQGKPKALIARTKKGRGVPSLEGQPLCHIMNPKSELIAGILKDLK